jgi:hypothetical protein
MTLRFTTRTEVLRSSRPDRLLLVAGMAGLGALSGCLFPLLADAVLWLPWVPFDGLLELVGAVHPSSLAAVTAVGGLVAGLVFVQVAMAGTRADGELPR